MPRGDGTCVGQYKERKKNFEIRCPHCTLFVLPNRHNQDGILKKHVEAGKVQNPGGFKCIGCDGMHCNRVAMATHMKRDCEKFHAIVASRGIDVDDDDWEAQVDWDEAKDVARKYALSASTGRASSAIAEDTDLGGYEQVDEEKASVNQATMADGKAFLRWLTDSDATTCDLSLEGQRYVEFKEAQCDFDASAITEAGIKSNRGPADSMKRLSSFLIDSTDRNDFMPGSQAMPKAMRANINFSGGDAGDALLKHRFGRPVDADNGLPTKQASSSLHKAVLMKRTSDTFHTASSDYVARSGEQPRLISQHSELSSSQVQAQRTLYITSASRPGKGKQAHQDDNQSRLVTSQRWTADYTPGNCPECNCIDYEHHDDCNRSGTRPYNNAFNRFKECNAVYEGVLARLESGDTRSSFAILPEYLKD